MGCVPGGESGRNIGIFNRSAAIDDLANTIGRAISAAEQRSHRYVTLEHLLLALLDDPDAQALLEGARADMRGLRSAAAETVNHNLATLYTPGEFDLRASYKVERAAIRLGRCAADGLQRSRRVFRRRGAVP